MEGASIFPSIRPSKIINHDQNQIRFRTGIFGEIRAYKSKEEEEDNFEIWSTSPTVLSELYSLSAVLHLQFSLMVGNVPGYKGSIN